MDQIAKLHIRLLKEETNDRCSSGVIMREKSRKLKLGEMPRRDARCQNPAATERFLFPIL